MEWLQFRDALRAQPALATRYAALKVELAARYSNDREAYTRAKDGFVLAALQAVPAHPSITHRVTTGRSAPT
jgi:GrpB-like predicted nucleotidyltransferase (UPF0157 family)